MAGLDPPPECGLVSNKQPARVEVQILDQQMCQLTRPKPGLRQHEMNRERPVVK